MKLKPLILSFSLLAFTGAAYANEQAKDNEKQAQQSSTTGGMSQSAQKDEQKSEGASAATGASGSTQTQQSTQTQAESQSAQQEQDKSGQSAAAGASGGSKQSQSGMTVDQIKDIKIVDSQGKELGQIEDIVIDLSSGKVHAAVLSFGGFMGIGDKNYAFQPTELKRGKSNDQLVLNIDKQKLEDADGFEKAQWPGMDDKYWSSVGGKQAGAGGGQSGQMNLIRASELEGKDVQDQSGKKVGQVQDVMIGLTEGQVRNIAVSLEDGGRVMVPAKSIKATGTEDRLVLSMDAQKLKQQAQRSGGEKQRGQRGAAGGTMGGSGASQSQPQSNPSQQQGTTK